MTVLSLASCKSRTIIKKKESSNKPKAGNLVEVTNPYISEDLGNTWLGVVVGESNVTLTVHFADDNTMQEFRKAAINNPNSNSYIIMDIVS